MNLPPGSGARTRWPGADQVPNLIVFIFCFGILAAALVITPPDTVSSYIRLGSTQLPTVCTMKNLTGIDCPGCGLVRSISMLAHGDVAGSLAYHRLGWLVLIYIAAQFVYRLALLARPAWRIRLTRYGRHLDRGVIGVAVLVAFNWIAGLI